MAWPKVDQLECSSVHYVSLNILPTWCAALHLLDKDDVHAMDKRRTVARWGWGWSECRREHQLGCRAANSEWICRLLWALLRVGVGSVGLFLAFTTESWQGDFIVNLQGAICWSVSLYKFLLFFFCHYVTNDRLEAVGTWGKKLRVRWFVWVFLAPGGFVVSFVAFWLVLIAESWLRGIHYQLPQAAAVSPSFCWFSTSVSFSLNMRPGLKPIGALREKRCRWWRWCVCIADDVDGSDVGAKCKPWRWCLCVWCG